MLTDPRIEAIISTQIPNQFPDFYREEGPIFVAFVTEYYRWMETEGQALFHSRRQMSYRDVDETVDRFLLHFKEEYLQGIQLDTRTDVRRLIKHSLDLYRAKGSQRAVELLFRLVFNEPARVSYPAENLLRASDGEWVRPVYLEVAPRSSNLNDFMGRQVYGMGSGARAFVERVVRKKIGGKWVSALYVSDVIGDFSRNELINRIVGPLPVGQLPRLNGSLTEVSVVDGASGYSVGDVVNLRSDRGAEGRARVTGVATENGRVSVRVANGGYGYSVNSSVLVSNSVLISDFISSSGPTMFTVFDEVHQTVVSASYSGLDRISPEIIAPRPGDTIRSSDITTTLVVESVGSTNSTAGTIRASLLGGPVQGGPYIESQGTYSMTLSSSPVSTTSTARLLSATRLRITVEDPSGFVAGQEVFLVDEAGYDFTDFVGLIGSIGQDFVDIESFSGTTPSFIRNQVNYYEVNLTSFDFSTRIVSASLRLGIISQSDPFVAGIAFAGNTMVRVTSVTNGTGFSASVASVANEETVTLNTDYLRVYANTPLSAEVYAFPGNPTANLGSVIGTALTFRGFTIGEVEDLTVTGFGVGYDLAPSVRVHEPAVSAMALPGWTVAVTGATEDFDVGEIVTQQTTGARGRVLEANSSVVVMSRMSLLKEFLPTSNSTTLMRGSSSGATANAEVVELSPFDPMETDINGLDAGVESRSSIASGVVRGLSVVDSGMGYLNGSKLFFDSEGGTLGTANSCVRGQGTGSGYFRGTGGFLSSDKVLSDGEYNQEFSYEVSSGVSVESYGAMLRKVVHQAGTRAFSSFFSRGTAVSEIAGSGSVTVNN